jgi:hypothetical protein
MARDRIPKRGKPMPEERSEERRAERMAILEAHRGPPLITSQIKRCCLPDEEREKRARLMGQIKREFSQRDREVISERAQKALEEKRARVVDRFKRRKARL